MILNCVKLESAVIFRKYIAAIVPLIHLPKTLTLQLNGVTSIKYLKALEQVENELAKILSESFENIVGIQLTEA